ncbi:uncharacterized protein SPSC_06107 [Sporisorium scitamineum]|uniref:Uncharacterized protein n=1 Tax=Sporisorium scitamineum TaxID=49012 RepID=A0A127ZIU2_9BASI|nr:uncharacterized protein SPSC_06107 [Sporisorium scitamineum]
MVKPVLIPAAVSALLTTLLPCILAVMSDIDHNYWILATQKYIKSPNSQEIPFASFRTNLNSFSHIKDLESKALNQARAVGVLLIARVKVEPSSKKEGKGETSAEIERGGRLSTAAETLNRERIYFSSIITPEDKLHVELGLKDEWAFAFWKHEDDISRLLHIDTLRLGGGEWQLEDLGKVLRHH